MISLALSTAVNALTLEHPRTEYQNEFLLSPLALSFGVVGLEYERALNPKLSMGGGYAFFKSETIITQSLTQEYEAYFFYRFWRDEFETPWMKFGYALNERSIDQSSGRRVRTFLRDAWFLQSGYRWRVAKDFSMRLGVGLSYVPSTLVHPFEPQMSWQVGYRF